MAFKISPIKEFGTFGVYVDNVDMDHMTDDDWLELGQLAVEKLVIVFRNINMSKGQYADWIPKWGPLKADLRARFRRKYGQDFDALKPETWEGIDGVDRTWLETRGNALEAVDDGSGRHLTRIYGGKDGQGKMMGAFAYGELYWHSNESSSLTFSPMVSLLGWEEMHNSCTGFVQTIDYYESLSDSFRRELNDMIVVHGYKAGFVNDNEHTDEVFSAHVKMSFCPDEGTETPLVCVAPNGRKGLHYTVNSAVKIKGMSDNESKKLFTRLDHELFTSENIFDHHYAVGSKDLLVFDNSVTLHRRVGGEPGRKAFRMQFDISPLIDKPWRPFLAHPEYDKEYVEKTHDLVNLVGGDLGERFKLPSRGVN